MVDKKIKGLHEEVNDVLKEYLEADEILERTVTKFGNSGHIPIPSKHIGKKAKIIIKKTENKKEKNNHNKDGKPSL